MTPLFSPTSTLGVSWLRGGTVFCRANTGAVWTSSGPVESVAEFAAAVEAGAAQLGVVRGEAHLLLAHSLLVHRVEVVPALRPAALRRYLDHRMAREAPGLRWSAVPLLAARGEERVLVQQMPADFVEQLGAGFANAGLRLQRIFPLSVALESAELAAAAANPRPGQYRLAAMQSGGQTVVVALRGDGALAFARSFAAGWDEDADRLGLEMNRSVIYLRQRWNTAPHQVTLYDGEKVRQTVAARCGGAAAPTQSVPSDLAGWLQRLGEIRAGDPRNLLATQRARQRRRWLGRWAVAAACWAGLALMGLSTWSEAEAMRAVREHTASLHARRPALLAARERLWRRNRGAAGDRELLERMTRSAVPPVPVRFLVYQASLLPPALKLSSYSAAWDGGRWTVAMDGQLRADDPAARARLQDWEDLLRNGPWKARIDADRVAADPRADATHFRVEGGLLEN